MGEQATDAALKAIAGLVTKRRQGTWRLYRVRPEGLDRLREFLNEMRPASLDAARQIVEADRGLAEAGPSAQAGQEGDTP